MPEEPAGVVQSKVPEVFVAFAVNVLPVVAGLLDAVSEAIASPSASVAVTVKLRFAPSATDRDAGPAKTTGARSTLATVTAVAAEPDSALVAVMVTVYDPAWVNAGVQLNVPDVFPGPEVNVLPVAGGLLDCVNDAIALPSGSVAVAVKVICVFSAPLIDAGAVTIGCRSTFVIVSIVVADELATPSFAVNVSAKVPTQLGIFVGVPLSVPVAWPTPGDDENAIPQEALGPTSVTVREGS